MVGKDDKMLPAAAWPSSHRCCLRERPQFWPKNSHSCHKFFPHKLERLQFIPPDDFWWNMVISIGRWPEQAGSSSAFGQSSGLPSPHRSCSQLSGSSPPPWKDNRLFERWFIPTLPGFYRHPCLPSWLLPSETSSPSTPLFWYLSPVATIHHVIINKDVYGPYYG